MILKERSGAWYEHFALGCAGMFLIASLGAESVYRFLIVLAVVTALYLVYGIHAAAHHDAQLATYTAGYTAPPNPARHEHNELLPLLFSSGHMCTPLRVNASSHSGLG